MGMKSDSDDDLKKRFKDLCLDLNLDKTSADESWHSYQRIGINYTLEGDKLHWLACAVYVACRKCVTQTVGRVGKIEGNCVSLTRLLRSCKLSLVQFFNKIKKWSDMANLSSEMRQKVDHLERNFNVSTVIFMKYKPIYENVFKDPTLVAPKQTKNRKQSRKQLITPADVFSFCWTLFVHIKSNFTQISDDLVNSYHLLLCIIDFCYACALNADNAHELLNPNFSELPSDFNDDNYKRPENPQCIVQALCNKWDGIYLDAKCIKEHWSNPRIKRFFENDLLRARNMFHYGVFDVSYFDWNMKNITKEYDQYVLNIGDFDERIFLYENANEELGTPQINTEELSDLMHNRQILKQRMEQTRTMIPTTPLSNRHYLSNRAAALSLTPVSSTTQSVSRIQSLLIERKDEPSEDLEKIFSECSVNPRDEIVKRLRAMGDRFYQAYCVSSNDDIHQQSFEFNNDEFAKKRLTLGVTLYYKVLEHILMREKKISNDKIPGIVNNETFHLSLFACSLEVVLCSYGANRTFPWILEVFSDGSEFRLQPFHFYKIIEPFIRDEEGLSRDAVKHLNSVEERILESLAWKGDSPLWEVIKNNGPIPSCADVSLPPQSTDASVSRAESIISNSPMADRFMSPIKSVGSAKRQLNFTTGGIDSGHSISNISSQQIVQIAIPAQTSTGEIKYIQVPAIALTLPQQQSNVSASGNRQSIIAEPLRPVKTGPLGLFFRKVYNLIGLRLNDLCNRLNIMDDELRRKIWTCLEFTLKNHTDLMRDRHLDQMIMCAAYAICKVTRSQYQTFQEIMRCYRMQPQAKSHVYRSVLLSSRRRRNSGSSDTSRNSGSSSPLLQEDRDRIRSSSTLPVPHPNSQPPTPTRVAGTGTHFEFEERGDVITFYNNVFLHEISKFIMKFTVNGQNGGSPPLSPLPRLNANPMSPYRRVSSKHSVYISPLKTANFPPSPNRPLSYRFLSSPAKDLRAINNMMKSGTSGRKVSKRILQDNDETENSPTKRQFIDPMNRFIRNIVAERHEANGGTFSGANGDLNNE